MPEYINSQLTLKVGDIVLHRSKGIVGRIINITAEPEPRVFIRGKDGGEYYLSLMLAATALSKLPPDGLTARVMDDRESLVVWEKSAPLRLVALALVDLNNAGKPGEIGNKLMGNKLLSTEWKNWWKKVQPAIKQSTHFKVHHDGAYELLSMPDSIPAEPLPSMAKKKEARLSSSQILDLLKQLQKGKISFEGIEGARAKHRVARELVTGARKDPQARGIIIGALGGPARSARIMLEEVVKKDDVRGVGTALEALLAHIVELASTADAADDSGTAEHLAAKLNLFRENLTKALSRADVDAMESLPVIAYGLLDLAVAFARANSTSWRTKANEFALQSLGSILVTNQPLATGIGRNLGAGQRETDARLVVAEGLVRTLPTEQKSRLLHHLVAGLVEHSIDLADRLIERLEPRDSHISWWVENFKDVQPAHTSDSATVAQALLERIGSRSSPQELDRYLQLIFLVVLVNPSVVLPGVAQNRIREWADGISLSETSDLQSLGKAGLSPLLVAMRAGVQLKQRKWDSEKDSLQLHISGLQDKVREGSETVARLEGVVTELKSGFHTPEKWTEYRAKKEVLERLGALYQEIDTLREKNSGDPTIRWMLNEVETILIRNGVSRFSETHGLVIFDPAQHEFIRGGESSEREVTVQTPGFLWKDPAGNSIVLVRARVTRK